MLAYGEAAAGCNGGRSLIGLALITVAAVGGPGLHHRRGALLLNDVRGFVRDEGEIGRVFAVAEKNVIAEGEGARSEGLGLALCSGAGVQPHRAQVDHQAVLDGLLNVRRQRLPGGECRSL